MRAMIFELDLWNCMEHTSVNHVLILFFGQCLGQPNNYLVKIY